MDTDKKSAKNLNSKQSNSIKVANNGILNLKQIKRLVNSPKQISTIFKAAIEISPTKSNYIALLPDHGNQTSKPSDLFKFTHNHNVKTETLKADVQSPKTGLKTNSVSLNFNSLTCKASGNPLDIGKIKIKSRPFTPNSNDKQFKNIKYQLIYKGFPRKIKSLTKMNSSLESNLERKPDNDILLKAMTTKLSKPLKKEISIQPQNNKGKLGDKLIFKVGDDLLFQNKLHLNLNSPTSEIVKSKKISSNSLTSYQGELAVSSGASGPIRSFGAKTYTANSKSLSNRFEVVCDIEKPTDVKGQWPPCSFIAIFDGHKGSECANFMIKNLRVTLFKNSYLFNEPKRAIKEAFAECEKMFLYSNTEINTKYPNKSGSSALVMLVLGLTMYIVNLGDCRAIASYNNGRRIMQLSNDHKPNCFEEKKRIISSGGRVYQ